MEYGLLESLVWWIGAIALGFLGYILYLKRELRDRETEAEKLREQLRHRSPPPGP